MTTSSSTWVTVSEAAKRLNVSREWVRQLLNEHVLDSRRDAHENFLITARSVEQYAAQRARVEVEQTRRQYQGQVAQARETLLYHRQAIGEAQRHLAMLPPDVRAQIEQEPPPAFPTPRRRGEAPQDDVGSIAQVAAARTFLDEIGMPVADAIAGVGTPASYWEQATGLTDPDAVVNWLSEGANRINGGAPLTTSSTDILRAAREERYRTDLRVHDDNGK